jgi:hypothetical protein
MACLALPYFPTFSQKRHNFRTKGIEYKMWFRFPLQLSSEIFLILRRIQRDITINALQSLLNVPVILVSS